MKKRIRVDCMMGMLLLSLSACSQNSDIYLEKYEESTSAVLADAMQVQQTEEPVMMTEEPDESEEKQVCYVYICGAIAQSGVYVLPEGSRIFEVIQKAGGLTEQADETYVNQAEPVTDGMMIRIYTQEETATFAIAESDEELEQGSADDGMLDINTATEAELMTLPGIGSAKAEAIVAYREAHGRFSCIEDLMKVPGIKEGLFNQMKERIKVKN